MTYWKSILAMSCVALLAVACGGKGDKKGKAAPKAEAKSEATAEPKAEAKAPEPPPAAAPATDAAAPPAASAPPAPAPAPTTAAITDTAVPPDTSTPPKPGDAILEPDSTKYDSYVIKQKDGTEVIVKWYWKDKDRITFQKAGGDISIRISEIDSVVGRPRVD